jgi:Family of unknown function (DUF6951)
MEKNMAKAEIFAGACGFNTAVVAHRNGRGVILDIQSECAAIRRLAEHLTEVDPLKEISFRRQLPQTYEAAHQYCSHAACPVPSGIIKAIEVEAGLALPRDVSIKITKDQGESHDG